MMSGGEPSGESDRVLARAGEDPAEKTCRLQTLTDAALALLDSLPPERRKSPQQRAVYEFLRGKILDVFADYRKEAEDHLSKAVKLNPSLVDAWLCLGNCIWKKGDLPGAKNCFTLALSKGPNKKILCQLSMLERSMAQGAENHALLVEESIKHAKEAVMLDIKDGNSWYNLGNACLTSFFMTGAWDHTTLHQSLKAYQNAEKDEMMKSYPDLYFNSATANKYLENYERALHGFEAAALKDPGLGADEEVKKIVTLLDKLEGSMKSSPALVPRSHHTNSFTEPEFNTANPSDCKVLLTLLHTWFSPSELLGLNAYFALTQPKFLESSTTLVGTCAILVPFPQTTFATPMPPQSHNVELPIGLLKLSSLLSGLTGIDYFLLY
uniref:Tetratricopeptide repeat protein 5-like n=1 Tax=Ananas comosus var. bracteatus TaxID=296719 RepID=A0A6V7PVH1_ANACO|nr:unnamed protein product [Ananas comosus var. bracteatus]